jgi:hypothetical protein
VGLSPLHRSQDLGISSPLLMIIVEKLHFLKKKSNALFALKTLKNELEKET